MKDKGQRNDFGELVYKVGTYSDGGEIDDDLKASRIPKNAAESACYDALTADGWKLTKRGWPDFFCVKDGRVAAVEVKPHKRSPLKRNQAVVMGLLSRAGIDCYKWTPDGGMELLTFEETPPPGEDLPFWN